MGLTTKRLTLGKLEPLKQRKKLEIDSLIDGPLCDDNLQSRQVSPLFWGKAILQRPRLAAKLDICVIYNSSLGMPCLPEDSDSCQNSHADYQLKRTTDIQ